MKRKNNKKNGSLKDRWGCRLKNIIVKRGDKKNGFCLKIPSLELSSNRMDCNKLPLMGISGAGKSTLLNLIAAMEWPAEGTVFWSFPDGEEIQWDKRGLSGALARRLRSKYFGYAFQASTLISHLKILDNLCYPLNIKGVESKTARKKAVKALDRVLLNDEKLPEIIQRFPFQLSGGQRQRVALVQAMIHNPHVLFADEPTGSLDRDTRDQVMNVLHNWVDESSGQRSLFWVTHHENDPHDANISQRISVEGGLCEWQRYNDNDWESV